MRRRLASLALGLYPQAWRDRYGEELATLVGEQPPTARSILDLLRGAADAHLHPRGTGLPAQDRMRNTVSATLFCWIAFVFAGAGFAKLIEDPPFRRAAHAHGMLGYAKTAVIVLALAAAIAAAVGGVSLVGSILRQALRRRDRQLSRSIAWTILALTPFVLVTGIGVWLAHAPGTIHPFGRVAFFAVWIGSGIATAIGCGLGARLVLRQADLKVAQLRRAVGGATVVSLAMAGMAVATAIYLAVLMVESPGLAALQNTPFDLATSLLIAVDALLMGALATLGAVTAVRGAKAARSL